jgi:tripeptide aminopeptidase
MISIPRDRLLERFLRYVQVDTRSDPGSESYPSTRKQLDLSRMLAEECRDMGLSNVHIDAFGLVTADIPATVGHSAPRISWLSHVDTSPETSGTNVKPVIHENYDGSDVVLPGNGRTIRTDEHPELKDAVGRTIITSDGTTLLGADDKAGIAVIMTTAEILLARPDIAHGPIRICFTCDEETGRGTEKLTLERLDSVCAYTLDGPGQGKIDVETFSADLAVITVEGVNTHPSHGKGIMVNALRILSRFINNLPSDSKSPESTEGREGFLHPVEINGGVAQAKAWLILRDFETEKLAEYAQLLEDIAARLRVEYPRAGISIDIKKQYRNLRDGLTKEPRAVLKAEEAMRAAGLEPEFAIIRGGTDGSLLTEMGLPTPNLSTGQHNPHAPVEWACLEEMEKAVEVLVHLAQAWGNEKV